MCLKEMKLHLFMHTIWMTFVDREGARSDFHATRVIMCHPVHVVTVHLLFLVLERGDEDLPAGHSQKIPRLHRPAFTVLQYRQYQESLDSL